jgi:hypothetical protein
LHTCSRADCSTLHQPSPPSKLTGQSADPRAPALLPTGLPTLGYPPAEQPTSRRLPAVQQPQGQVLSRTAIAEELVLCSTSCNHICSGKSTCSLTCNGCTQLRCNPPADAKGIQTCAAQAHDSGQSKPAQSLSTSCCSLSLHGLQRSHGQCTSAPSHCVHPYTALHLIASLSLESERHLRVPANP